MERLNAWERAQEAITRAAERSDDVVTPDNAVSPFDASMTTVIPHADVVRRGPPDPDSTQRLPHGRPPAPRHSSDAPNGHVSNGQGHTGQAPNGHHYDPAYDHSYDHPWDHYGPSRREPQPRPPEMSDPALPRVAPGPPGTAPFPAGTPLNGNGHGDGTPPHGFPSAGEHDGYDSQNGYGGQNGYDDREAPRRPWWKRLFGR